MATFARRSLSFYIVECRICMTEPIFCLVICGISRGADNRIYANADFRKAGGTDGYWVFWPAEKVRREDPRKTGRFWRESKLFLLRGTTKNPPKSWWLERLTANAEVAKVLRSISASSDTVISEGRQMKKCWIQYIKYNPNPRWPSGYGGKWKNIRLSADTFWREMQIFSKSKRMKT